MSVFFITMADTREIDKLKHNLVIKRVCNTLSWQWEDNSSKKLKFYQIKFCFQLILHLLTH